MKTVQNHQIWFRSSQRNAVRFNCTILTRRSDVAKTRRRSSSCLSSSSFTTSRSVIGTEIISDKYYFFNKLNFFKQANFILFDPVQKEVTTSSHHELFSRIKRPKDCSVFNQTVLICTVPAQDPEVIADIEKAGLELRITAYRPSDNKMSKTR